MNRLEFQALAEERIVDARALLAVGQWSAAYYLAGYAVECGLKACILKRVTAASEVIFEDRKFSDKCWTHAVEPLLELAGLEDAFEADLGANPALKKNWPIVCAWNEQVRYQTISQDKAEKFFEAVTEPTNGVMSWIGVRW